METKMERVMNTVQGLPTERQAFTFWTHLPRDDHDPERLAEATYRFYKKYDIDLIKTMDNGMYAVEDYGCRIDYREILSGGAAKLVSTPVRQAADLAAVGRLELSDAPALQRELRSLQRLVEWVKDENVPILFTIFSPLTTLNKLTDGKVISYIEEGNGNLVHGALRAVCDTTIELARQAVTSGATGVFLASQMCRRGVCNEEQYREYGVPYDRAILDSAAGSLRAFHAHGTEIMYDLIKDYPCEIFNWHAGETLPDLEEAALSGKCLMAGLVRSDITESNYDALKEQIRGSIARFHGRKQIIAPGCVIRYPLNEDTLHFIKQTIDQYYS